MSCHSTGRVYRPHQFNTNTQMCFRWWHFLRRLKSKYNILRNLKTIHTRHTLLSRELEFKLCQCKHRRKLNATLCRHQPHSTSHQQNLNISQISHFNSHQSSFAAYGIPIADTDVHTQSRIPHYRNINMRNAHAPCVPL